MITKPEPFAELAAEMTPIDPASFAPAPAPPRLAPAQSAQLSRVAEEKGFSINNFEEKPITSKRFSRNKRKEVVRTLRTYVSDWNQFQAWCNANDYTQKQGFEKLVALLPAPKR
jgi:hypothetical protein